MGELEEPALRELAADLYEEAQRRLDSDEGTPADLLREVCASLEGVLERQRYHEAVDAYRQGGQGRTQGAQELQEILEHRRRQGYIPEAMPSGVRPDA